MFKGIALILLGLGEWRGVPPKNLLRPLAVPELGGKTKKMIPVTGTPLFEAKKSSNPLNVVPKSPVRVRGEKDGSNDFDTSPSYLGGFVNYFHCYVQFFFAPAMVFAC